MRKNLLLLFLPTIVLEANTNVKAGNVTTDIDYEERGRTNE